jgi:hypothetical protein
MIADVGICRGRAALDPTIRAGATICWPELFGLCRGLPMERRQRLPKVDRAAARADLTRCQPWDFRLSGVLPPAVPGEESGWLLPESFVRNSV